MRSSILLAALVLVASGVVLVFAYGHYTRMVDRRLRHSALFAARPRVEGMVPRRGPGPALPLSTASFPRPARRTPAFDALPPFLVQAVVSIEDRRFFSHSGVDYARIAKCAVQDVLSFHAVCGGSTLTQQLARVDFLSQRKTVRRKIAEILIARRLEQRLTKQQIFAMYAAGINLGQRGPQPIRGFSEASRAYFGQDLRQLNLAQCALLAGMIHAPNFDNPNRHPDRALRRRNVVLDAMVDTGAITRAEAETAKAEPLRLAGLGPLFLFAPEGIGAG